MYGTLAESSDHAVVHGVASKSSVEDSIVLEKGKSALVRSLVAPFSWIHDGGDRRFVAVDEITKFAPLGSHIRNANGIVHSQLTFNLEGIIHRIGSAGVQVPSIEGDNASATAGHGRVRAKQFSVLVQRGCPRVSGCGKRSRQDQGQIQSHVHRDIRENVVIAEAEASANDCFSIAEGPRKNLGTPGYSHERSIVIVIGACLSASRKEKIHRSQRNGVAAKLIGIDVDAQIGIQGHHTDAGHKITAAIVFLSGLSKVFPT